ncbi:hypothetical protein V8G54_020571 [Vigna mungo]|uniref:Uncharacterized protein n=1 Tax=Vigna mungo TaxID=3915 RepID=A0AAQ3NE05_VIGMU
MVHGSFLFTPPSSSPWKQNTFYSAISMHDFTKAQQRKHTHVTIYSVLLRFEPKKQYQPPNLQELQNSIRPFSQSPSCLSISHCPFWSSLTTSCSFSLENGSCIKDLNTKDGFDLYDPLTWVFTLFKLSTAEFIPFKDGECLSHPFTNTTKWPLANNQLNGVAFVLCISPSGLDSTVDDYKSVDTCLKGCTDALQIRNIEVETILSIEILETLEPFSSEMEQMCRETKRKFESVYEGGTMNTPDSGKVFQYWHCCGSEDPFDPGCTSSPHASYDD